MTGLRAFIAAGLPVSLSAVVLRSTLHALPIFTKRIVPQCGVRRTGSGGSGRPTRAR